VFLVARIGWKVETRNGGTDIWEDLRNVAGEDRRFVPVAAFATRDAAEARTRELELEAARLFNPFCRLGPLAAQTSLPEDDFRRLLGELVASLPDAPLDAAGRTRFWRLWWEEYMPTWSDEVLAKVWDLLDRIRFYEVLEVEAE
jgi:hypothetical protein